MKETKQLNQMEECSMSKESNSSLKNNSGNRPTENHSMCLAATELTREESNTIKNNSPVWLDRFVEDIGNGSLMWR